CRAPLLPPTCSSCRLRSTLSSVFGLVPPAPPRRPVSLSQESKHFASRFPLILVYASILSVCPANFHLPTRHKGQVPLMNGQNLRTLAAPRPRCQKSRRSQEAL